MPCNCRVSCNFIKKETLAQLFSCEFCEISKNNFLTEHLRTTASVTLLQLHTYFHLPLFPYRSSHRTYSIKKGYIKFRKIHRKPSVLEPLFNKNAGLQPIKRRLHRRCFPVNIPKFEIEWSYYQKCSHFLDKYLTSCLYKKHQVFIQAILVSVTRHKKLNFATEFWNSIFILVVCLFLFLLKFTKLLEFICNSNFGNQIKSYLHVSYMQLLDCLCIHNLYNILTYTENENLKL